MKNPDSEMPLVAAVICAFIASAIVGVMNYYLYPFLVAHPALFVGFLVVDVIANTVVQSLKRMEVGFNLEVTDKYEAQD